MKIQIETGCSDMFYREYYSKRTFQDKELTVYGIGEMVAVKFCHDNQWYRGRCIEPDPDNSQVKVSWLIQCKAIETLGKYAQHQFKQKQRKL